MDITDTLTSGRVATPSSGAHAARTLPSDAPARAWFGVYSKLHKKRTRASHFRQQSVEVFYPWLHRLPAGSVIMCHRRAFAVACGVGAALILSSCASRPASAPGKGPDLRTGALATSSQPAASAIGELNRGIAAQVTPAPNEPDLPLGVGDLIEITVADVPEFWERKFRIPHSRRVMLPLLGSTEAAGQSALELESAIRRRLRERYMHDPQVTVFVLEHKSERISVVGAVRAGGVFTVSHRLRLADALAMAGGLTEEAGHVVYVIRRSAADDGSYGAPEPSAGAGEPKSSAPVVDRSPREAITAVDLEGLARGRPEFNLRLESGDVVEIPRAGSFYVGGEVQKPGSFSLKSHTTVEQATVAAGGVKPVADRDDIRLYRTGPDGQREVLTYSLNEFEKGVHAPEVRASDVIIVGKSGIKAFFYAFLDFVRFGVGASIPP
jgi:polysaccharide biosynthesis/export protein